MWLSDALHRPVAVLPVESGAALAAYVRDFAPAAIVLMDNERASADAIRALGCVTELTPAPSVDAPGLAIFVNTGSCR